MLDTLYSIYTFPSTGFVMMKVAETSTVFNYRPATWLYYVAGSGSGVKLLPPVMAAHAGNIESIVAQITPTMCFSSPQKNFNSVSTVLYSSILRRTISNKFI